MAMQSGQSNLLARYGSRIDQAVAQHANDETDFGFQRLPPGITNAVLQLKECGFEPIPEGKANAGEVRYRAMGVVMEPEFFVTQGGQKVKIGGTQVFKFITVGDTKTAKGEVTSLNDHVAEIMNELRLLGGDGFTKNVRTAADLVPLAAALQNRKPPLHFYLSTRAGQVTPAYPNPRTWEDWLGSRGLENYSPPNAAAGAMRDVSGQGNGAVGQAAPTNRMTQVAAKTTEETVAAANDQTDDQPSVSDEPEQFDEFGDVNDLAAKADAGDKAAMRELKRAALNAGLSEEQIDGVKKWQDVADMLLSSSDSVEQGDEQSEVDALEPEPEPEPWKPVKEELYSYQQIDPKTKKPLINPKTKQPVSPIKVEVTGVWEKSQTVTLKSVESQKPLIGADKKPLAIGWDDLIK